jgi:HAD superfamily hydrolase (TIGR01509 family)
MMLFQSLPTSVNRALQEAHWLFFDLGNTLISEDAATECRIQRLVEALARHGRRYSTDEVRSAFEEAAATFALRPVITVIGKLVDDPACRRAVAAQAPYSKELEAPYDEAEDVLRTLSGSYKIGVIANQSVSSTERLTKWGLMPYISTCLCSFELGLEKPDPAIFQLALHRAGCAASQAVIIGDRLDNDIRPARLLGWRTIRVLQGFARFQSPRDLWG